MRVDWIEDIVALLDSGGVADAARLRNLTQPAFSRRIKVLEEVLGIEIIDRSVKPSGPSQVLRDHETDLRKMAAEIRMLFGDMRREQTNGSRQLVIASQHAITTSLGPQLVKIIAEPSRTHIRMRSANRDECETLLIQRQAAISLTYNIVAEARPEPPAFLTEAIIGSETLIPVCSAAHAEEIRQSLTQDEIPIISYPSDVFLGAAMSRHILPALVGRCRPTVVTETGLTTAALQLSLSGLGIAWVPHALAEPSLQRGELSDLRLDFGHIDMALVARRWSATTDSSILGAWHRLTTQRFDTIHTDGSETPVI